mmetsp:Transcript_7821/g.18726  ORF Transcript_7821/g.18726 Transcript_7821/m.18726 type:complete len:247 (-) Transcript_7821:278-1018(-)
MRIRQGAQLAAATAAAAERRGNRSPLDLRRSGGRGRPRRGLRPVARALGAEQARRSARDPAPQSLHSRLRQRGARGGGHLPQTGDRLLLRCRAAGPKQLAAVPEAHCTHRVHREGEHGELLPGALLQEGRPVRMHVQVRIDRALQVSAGLRHPFLSGELGSRISCRVLSLAAGDTPPVLSPLRGMPSAEGLHVQPAAAPADRDLHPLAGVPGAHRVEGGAALRGAALDAGAVPLVAHGTRQAAAAL